MIGLGTGNAQHDKGLDFPFVNIKNSFVYLIAPDQNFLEYTCTKTIKVYYASWNVRCGLSQ